jgi:hypothetical protein
MKFSGIKEYAQSRGLAYSTVSAMCRDGTLPAVKIGQRHKIEVEGADRYFNEQIELRQKKLQKLKCPVIISKHTRRDGGGYLDQLNLMRKEVK